MTRLYPFPAVIAVSLSFTLASCDGNPSEPADENPPEPVPTTLEVLSGDAQSGVVAAPLAQEITVRVLSAAGDGMPGLSVTFSTEDGGSFAPSSGTTDEAGSVSTTWTLGSEAGTQTATVSTPDVPTATITATAEPGEAVDATLSATALELGKWGDTASVAVEFVDEYGNVVGTANAEWSSSDTSVVRVDGSGGLTTWNPGNAEVTVAPVSAALRSSGGNDVVDPGTPVALRAVAGTVQVSVPVQQNPACVVPGPPAAPGPVAPPVAFEAVRGPNAPGETGSTTHLVVVIDANDDGLNDVISTAHQPVERETYDWVKVHLNQGNRTFTDGTDQVFDTVSWTGPGPSFFSHPRDWVRTDMNGDGRLDLFVTQTGYDPGGVDGLGCGDVDCDGARNVLLIAEPGGGFVDVATETFVPWRDDGFTHAGAGADIDCDGDTDLFEGQWGNEAPQSLLVNDGGVFTQENSRLPAFITADHDIAGARFCDLDRDGDQDFVVGRTGAALEVLINDGFGTFRALTQAVLPDPPSPLSENIVSDLNCADLNGDGYPEIVGRDHSFNEYEDTWQLLTNRGDMTFSDGTGMLPDPEGKYSNPPSGGTTMATDMNGDGWVDLMGAPNPLRILWNQGGTFTEEILLTGYGEPLYGGSFATGDVDGDGHMDLWAEGGQGLQGWIFYGR
jgi:hypothetical protein